MKKNQLFFAPVSELMDGDNKYSRAIKIPQYNPSNVKPKELLREINLSDVPEDVKEFLKLGATRHIVFNYSKIADYYAYADADIQRLIEQSALVIIDIDDAIANGYVRLSQRMNQLINEEKERRNNV